ncbi:MAG TPA: YbaK/EbsC family protein, partial [Candidatus Limnocylindrales bacterium]|nr:YbaK/EbsC family protein [Candidatus Limnocylindrales bacterium]
MSRVDTAETARPHPGLIEWLAKNRVEFEVKEHPLTYTAMETARAEGIDPRRFAKVVGVEADGKAALLVVDALDQVDLDKAARAMAARHVRLLNEKELLDLAPGCAAGTIPPIGELFGLPVYVDHAIREDP